MNLQQAYSMRLDMVREEGIIMANELLDKYAVEKNNMKKILIGSRMTEIWYGETFNLVFKRFCCDMTKEMQFMLTLDTSCWFGNRDEWLARAKTFQNKCITGEDEDCLLAYDLTRLRYNNLIQVEAVDFFDDSLSITFEGNNILTIAYEYESDYTWILEEVSQKKEQDRMVIGCQGNEMFQNNIPIHLH